jgi:hypothetical protein
MDRLKHLATPLLLFAVLMITLPLIELAGALWPVGLGNAEWRFGAVGLLSNALMQPLLGSFILVLVAALGEKRWLQQAMWVFNALAAVFLLALVPLFVLDALELRSRVPDGANLAFDVASTRAVFVHGFAAVVLAALSRGGFRASKKDATDVGEPKTEPSPMIKWSGLD